MFTIIIIISSNKLDNLDHTIKNKRILMTNKRQSNEPNDEGVNGDDDGVRERWNQAGKRVPVGAFVVINTAQERHELCALRLLAHEVCTVTVIITTCDAANELVAVLVSCAEQVRAELTSVWRIVEEGNMMSCERTFSVLV